MSSAAPTTTLGGLRNRHRQGTVIVAGCGPSVRTFPWPAGIPVVGVNDIASFRHPDYLVLRDKPDNFTPERLAVIVDKRPAYTLVSTAMEKRWRPLIPDAIPYFFAPTHPSIAVDDWDVRRHMAHLGGKLHLGGGTPITALSLAGFMGAKRIGVIGVDLGDHHKFSQPDALAAECAVWGHLCRWLNGRGIEVVNLSSVSSLTTIPRMRAEEFATC